MLTVIVMPPSVPFAAFKSPRTERWFVIVDQAAFSVTRTGGTLNIERAESTVPPKGFSDVNQWHDVPHQLGREFLAYLTAEEREGIRRAHAWQKEAIAVFQRKTPDHFNDVIRMLEHVEFDLAAGAI